MHIRKAVRSAGIAVGTKCVLRDVYDILNAGEHHRFTVSGRLVHNCGYGGSVGALVEFRFIL